MQHVVVGTAGHIDHGKSALVLALTGTNPDRLREEKERGITIDLGFAHTTEQDAVLSFVDVLAMSASFATCSPVSGVWTSSCCMWPPMSR